LKWCCSRGRLCSKKIAHLSYQSENHDSPIGGNQGDLINTIKVDSIVACLAPCLPSSGKLECAKFECINGREYSKCGFWQLWSGGARKAVLKQNDKVRANTIIAGPEWKESRINSHHHTQQVANTIAQDDDNGNEYSPTNGKNARKLVLDTTSGDLVEFLDKYEETTENMPNIVTWFQPREQHPLLTIRT